MKLLNNSGENGISAQFRKNFKRLLFHSEVTEKTFEVP